MTAHITSSTVAWKRIFLKKVVSKKNVSKQTQFVKFDDKILFNTISMNISDIFLLKLQPLLGKPTPFFEIPCLLMDSIIGLSNGYYP